MTKRRKDDPPEHNGPSHRERHPLDGPDSDWGREVSDQIRSMRDNVGMMHHENQRAMNNVAVSVQSLDSKISDHIVKDEAALEQIQSEQKQMKTTIAAQPTTEQLRGLLGAWTAWRGVAMVTKWGSAGLVVVAAALVAIATIFGVILWAMGKGPLPHVHIGS